MAFIGKNFEVCSRYPVSRRCTAEAWPRLVVFPVDYRWCLCGQVLEEGEGEVEHGGGTLSYDLDGRYLTFDTELGDEIECDLCVSAIDARGRELFTCVHLSKGETDTRCGPGRTFHPKPSLELIPCDPLIAVATWEPVGGSKVQQQFARALEAVAEEEQPVG